ncbi:arsenate reductase ArsC [Azomonas macrocytogenes]|uniref:Protein-tyrosine-phosphatase n=1 Tax=Azomonas macrocytogenes TaxID=69962 RepID=A0A839T483_AZOMA|nr:arsenate reductase ArsC [Azomonas macrocytogenes]MBB3103296.1 protein-tyrosine-phosphatase [Azomonas macrocytogenes]
MKVLFMCTHNSCRSILSEALFNHFAPAGMQAISSGSHPSGQVNPRALEILEAAGIPTTGLYSKASDEFEHSPPDIVITVCDRAAGEVCPLFFGPSLKAHWGLADPSATNGSEQEIRAAFMSTLDKIRTRIQAFIKLPFDSLDHAQLKAEIARIGRL